MTEIARDHKEVFWIGKIRREDAAIGFLLGLVDGTNKNWHYCDIGTNTT